MLRAHTKRFIRSRVSIVSISLFGTTKGFNHALGGSCTAIQQSIRARPNEEKKSGEKTKTKKRKKEDRFVYIIKKTCSFQPT